MKDQIKNRLQKDHSLIKNGLEKTLNSSASDLAFVNEYAKDLSGKLLSLTTAGKMIRGSLVLIAYDLFGGGQFLVSDDRDTHQALPMAEAAELIHAALVIHDDIMDGDELRRGQRAIHAAYRDQLGSDDRSRKIGEGLAICLGDMAIFLGFSRASMVKTGALSEILVDLAREYQLVGLGQMADVGASLRSIDQNQTLSIYRYKTARYTFSMPLKLGAWLAGADREVRENLVQIGESLGIIYQIRDDSLNIFGDLLRTGKPLCSDIKENKQTLIKHHLFGAASQSEKAKLEMIFGNQDASIEQLEWVREVIKRLKVLDQIELEVKKHQAKIASVLESANFSTEQNQFFLSLEELLSHRDR